MSRQTALTRADPYELGAGSPALTRERILARRRPAVLPAGHPGGERRHGRGRGRPHQGHPVPSPPLQGRAGRRRVCTCWTTGSSPGSRERSQPVQRRSHRAAAGRVRRARPLVPPRSRSAAARSSTPPSSSPTPPTPPTGRSWPTRPAPATTSTSWPQAAGLPDPSETLRPVDAPQRGRHRHRPGRGRPRRRQARPQGGRHPPGRRPPAVVPGSL